jgi:hypothetical protein
MLFGAESLNYVQHMLRGVDPVSLLIIRQATGNPDRGGETKPDVVQNSENYRGE